jgi:hypothetical protein
MLLPALGRCQFWKGYRQKNRVRTASRLAYHANFSHDIGVERVVYKTTLHDPQAAARDLAYWLSRPLAERIAAMETLRERAYGSLPRLQRTARIIQRPPR